jgi:nitrite reductase/ring-hydroxylating ferredoxin subunit
VGGGVVVALSAVFGFGNQAIALYNYCPHRNFPSVFSSGSKGNRPTHPAIVNLVFGMVK